MPYTMNNLPDNIKKLPKNEQTRWMNVFNNAFKQHKDEKKAFAIANGVLKERLFDLKEQAPVGSYEHAREVVDSALSAQYSKIWPQWTYSPYMMYVFPEYLICSYQNQFYQVPYTMSIMGEVEFGEPSKVEQYFASTSESAGDAFDITVAHGKTISKDIIGRPVTIISTGAKGDVTDISKDGKVTVKVGDISQTIDYADVSFGDTPSSDTLGGQGADMPTPGQRGNVTESIQKEIRESGIQITREAVDMDFDFDSLTLKENSYDAASGVVEVILIEAGTNPMKKRHYPKSTIQEAAKDFKGLKMYMNHPTVREEAERPERNLRDWVSTITESWYEDGKAMAKVAVHDDWLKERLADPVARAHIGLSINAGGKVSYGTIDGQEMQVVEKILVNRQNGPASVDWVTEAGARGRVSRLLKESSREDINMKTLREATLEDLQRENPQLLESITTHVREQIAKNSEGEKSAKALKEAQDKIAEFEKRDRISVQKNQVVSWLKESKLPQVTQDRLMGEFTSKVFGSDRELKESFDARVKEERDYLNKISTKGRINLGESGSNAEGESIKESIETALEKRMKVSEPEKKGEEKN